jgi:RimJ/RimL family protein N-acetyltransferase
VNEILNPPSPLPVGAHVDNKQAQRPGPLSLQGRHGRIEKLAPAHAQSLWDAVKGHDAMWTYLAYGPFTSGASFSTWIAERAELADPFSYAIIGPDGRAFGIATLMEIRPAMRVIEVGHIIYSPIIQRTPLATEAIFLLARYAFETLGYRRFEWKCDALNAASRSAALRYGFTFEGVFRQHMIIKGRNRDTAWFSMLDSEWPIRKANFERWLAPENFASDSRQIASLRAMNAAK